MAMERISQHAKVIVWVALTGPGAEDLEASDLRAAVTVSDVAPTPNGGAWKAVTAYEDGQVGIAIGLGTDVGQLESYVYHVHVRAITGAEDVPLYSGPIEII